MTKKITIIGLSICLLFILDFSYSFWRMRGVIYPGVYIENIDIGFLSKEEALNKIEELYIGNEENRGIIVSINESEFYITFKDLGVEYNIEEALEECYLIGRENNLLRSYYNYRFRIRKDFKLVSKFHEEYFQKYIENIKKQLCKCSEDATIEVKNGDIIIKSEVIGLGLEEGRLREEILSRLHYDNSNDDIIVEANLLEVVPRVIRENLSPINSVIASYETNIYNSSESRTNNINICTKSINGTLILPGEEFSFNEIVGPRSSSKGYENAKVIINNRFQDDIGGGVCQVSSTLHNAILRANIDPTERSGHSKAVKYVDYGYDATVSYGYLDYKFINTLPYAIYIEGKVSNNWLSFNIYSSKELNKMHYEIGTVNEKYIEPNRIIEEDKNLYIGSRIVKQSGERGWSADIYRYTYYRGELTNEEFIYYAYIKPKDEIVRVGIKR